MISFSKKIAVLVLFLLFILFGAYVVKPAAFHEFKINVAKYTNMNIPQNTGYHQLVLRVIEKVNNILPSYDYVDFERFPNEVGIEEYNEKLFLENTFITKEVIVSTVQEIIFAFDHSLPGTSILVAPGVYRFEKSYFNVTAEGTLAEPILLHSKALGDVIFEMNSREGFVLKGSNWRIQNIIFKGIRDKNDKIDHAIHIVGNADNIQIMHNEFINFNAHIKSNGTVDKTGTRLFPDNILIANNNFFNEWKRDTLNAVTPIDVVGGNNWIIKNNFIADFANYGRHGRAVVYGAFLKGGGENGIFENNVINCSWKVPYTSANDIRIGLSFGGGGTGQQFCPNGLCSFEHKNGELKNNTILNCANDVGIYINKGQNISIHSNVIKNSLGIDVRFENSSAEIFNNYLDGRVKSRDKAIIKAYDNTFLN